MNTVLTLSKYLIFYFFLVGCESAPSDPELENALAIQERYGSVKQPFNVASFEKYIADKNYSVTKANNVIFVMIDTLRRDYLTDELAPNISQFLRENNELNGVSSSTITHHSMFSIFYGSNAYLRDFTLKRGWHTGSPFLNIFKNFGYRLSVYGSPWQYCIDEKKLYTDPKELKDYSESNLQLLYGMRSKDLLDFCYEHGQAPSEPQLFPKVPFIEKDNLGRKFGHQAYLDNAVAKDFLEDIKNQHEKNFYLLYLFSSHLPYAWADRGSLSLGNPNLKSFSPNVPWQPGESGFKEKDTTSVINSYKNSIVFIDYVFKKTIDELKRLNKYDNALIVLYSDHGEFLYDESSYPEASNRVGHCCTPYAENTRVPLAYKLPMGSKEKPIEGPDKLGTHIDIMPTVLDYLGFSDMKGLSNYIQGSSVLKKERRCVTTFSPAGILGPRIFTISIGNKMYYLQLNNLNPLKSDGFYFLKEYSNRELVFTFDSFNIRHVAHVNNLMENEDFLECLNEVFVHHYKSPLFMR